MLLCGTHDLEPGMVVGASITHPSSPATELLRPGVDLDTHLIGRLKVFGVTQVWVHHLATDDLDAAVASGLNHARKAVFHQLKRDFTGLAEKTISVAQVQAYRQSIHDLFFELISAREYARLSDQLLSNDDQLFSHSANVAFLSLLAGLELESYIIQERSRLSAENARDRIVLGLAAMFHDIGKLRLDPQCAAYHEIHGEPDESPAPDTYDTHAREGYELLREPRIPPSVRQAVLNHHQRFDGTGWPDMTKFTEGRQEGPQEGRQIHIFSRIIAAANVLENLLTNPDGSRRPAVAALRDFLSNRFDGWFDPQVRAVMARRIPPFPIGAAVRLSDDQRAVVVKPNPVEPCYPTVRTFRPHARSRDESFELLELAWNRTPHIVECAGEKVEPYLFQLKPLSDDCVSSACEEA